MPVFGLLSSKILLSLINSEKFLLKFAHTHRPVGLQYSGPRSKDGKLWAQRRRDITSLVFTWIKYPDNVPTLSVTDKE